VPRRAARRPVLISPGASQRDERRASRHVLSLGAQEAHEQPADARQRRQQHHPGADLLEARQAGPAHEKRRPDDERRDDQRVGEEREPRLQAVHHRLVLCRAHREADLPLAGAPQDARGLHRQIVEEARVGPCRAQRRLEDPLRAELLRDHFLGAQTAPRRRSH